VKGTLADSERYIAFRLNAEKMLNMRLVVCLCVCFAVLAAWGVPAEGNAEEKHSALLTQLTADLTAVSAARDAGKGKPVSLDDLARDQACWRNLKPRKGHVPSKQHPCDAESEVKENGICYTKCSAKYQGIGPACLSECRCNYGIMSLFFCCADKDVCTALLSEVVTKLPLELSQLIVDLVREQLDAEKILQDFRALMETVINLMLPMCDDEIPSECGNKHTLPLKMHAQEDDGVVTIKEAL
jgi:hypothetical protein